MGNGTQGPRVPGHQVLPISGAQAFWGDTGDAVVMTRTFCEKPPFAWAVSFLILHDLTSALHSAEFSFSMSVLARHTYWVLAMQCIFMQLCHADVCHATFSSQNMPQNDQCVIGGDLESYMVAYPLPLSPSRARYWAPVTGAPHVEADRRSPPQTLSAFPPSLHVPCRHQASADSAHHADVKLRSHQQRPRSRSHQRHS